MLVDNKKTRDAILTTKITLEKAILVTSKRELLEIRKALK